MHFGHHLNWFSWPFGSLEALESTFIQIIILIILQNERNRLCVWNFKWWNICFHTLVSITTNWQPHFNKGFMAKRSILFNDWLLCQRQQQNATPLITAELSELSSTLGTLPRLVSQLTLPVSPWAFSIASLDNFSFTSRQTAWKQKWCFIFISYLFTYSAILKNFHFLQ